MLSNNQMQWDSIFDIKLSNTYDFTVPSSCILFTPDHSRKTFLLKYFTFTQSTVENRLKVWVLIFIFKLWTSIYYRGFRIASNLFDLSKPRRLILQPFMCRWRYFHPKNSNCRLLSYWNKEWQIWQKCFCLNKYGK